PSQCFSLFPYTTLFRSLVDYGHVAFARHHRGFDSLRAKFVHGYKSILVGTDVVVIVGPGMNAGAPIEPRFRRKGRPTDVIVAFADRKSTRLNSSHVKIS